MSTGSGDEGLIDLLASYDNAILPICHLQSSSQHSAAAFVRGAVENDRKHDDL